MTILNEWDFMWFNRIQWDPHPKTAGTIRYNYIIKTDKNNTSVGVKTFNKITSKFDKYNYWVNSFNGCSWPEFRVTCLFLGLTMRAVWSHRGWTCHVLKNISLTVTFSSNYDADWNIIGMCDYKLLRLVQCPHYLS